ncbi:unnamed protein product [Vicia faba]|uniref:NAD(P)-binding domain-containing protein n=1 Tax=Vicia faba TaxID=3906 RepID=A0AAV1B4M6_VICFA|nr:unnamed protein product [Vicia faba]
MPARLYPMAYSSCMKKVLDSNKNAAVLDNRMFLVFSPAVEKLEIVECDLEKPNQIGSALWNASTVICTIGASEKEIFDITGPCRIDYKATKNLVDAATVAKVNHFILVTSLGTNKFGFPAAILKPGGMERPTDAYKEKHNVTLSAEDTLFGGQVSNLQVAELMATMAKNPDLSYCKIVEVIAETNAPLTPAEKLLTTIPSQRPYVSPPKKPDTATVSNPGPPDNVVAEVLSIAPEIETEQPKPVAKTEQPLSPYTAYDDLKPPSSPSPTKPSEKKQINISDAVPTPISSDTPGSIQEIDGISQTTSSSKAKESLSPYAAYPDLKPPSSPSPSVPTTSISKIDTVVSSNGAAQLSVEDTPKDDGQPLHEPKSIPLSPYAMYEDLKPPASPSPSFRKS